MAINEETVAFLGCARNCDKYIENSIKNIEKLGGLFKEYKVFIFENDSSDNTKGILNIYSLKDNYDITHMDKLIQRISLRTWRLAFCRQFLLEKLVKSKFNPDYVIVLDLDNVGEKNIDINEFKNCFKIKNWDGIFPKTTYDWWALRYDNYLVNYIEAYTYIKILSTNLSISTEKFQKIVDTLTGNIKKIEDKFDNNGILKVKSAFNGMGIYKYKTFIKGKYCGKNKYFITGKIKYAEECEHVNFHYSLGDVNLLMNKNFNFN
jgi:hypothetical protein